MFATLVEPFLVLLNRLRCILQPFHDLRKGNKPAATTLETSYTSLPPQFTLWDALKSGHFMLASLCAVSLLANVFAVALGAIFNELPITVTYSTTLQQTQLPAWEPTRTTFFSDSTMLIYDHFYVVNGNLSSGTRLLPWTDSKFAYLPFAELAQGVDNSSWTYRAQTRGFGVEAVCSPLSMLPDSLPYVNYTLDNEGRQDYHVLYSPDDGGPVVQCSAFTGINKGAALNASNGVTPGYLAQELVTSLRRQGITGDDGAIQEVDDKGLCERKLLLSWWRIDPADRNATLGALHLQCVPIFRTAVFDVVVDSSGYVLESTRVGKFDNISNFDWNQTQLLLDDGIGLIGTGASIQPDSTSLSLLHDSWHNDTLTRDWMSYLLKVAMDSTRLVDAEEPVPDAVSTGASVEDLIQRFFSYFLGRDPTLFKATTTPMEVTGTRMVPETRIFMDQTAFIITMTILCLNIVVATALYIQERKSFLPRLPATIGSILAYVAASTAVREYMGPNESRTSTGRWGPKISTYAFGNYVGVDGRTHAGIEAHPFVVPRNRVP